MRTIRVVTLNTWKNDGNYARRLDAMAAGLRALEPDIVLLQESFRTLDDSAHTARHLARALELSLAYAPARAKLRRWRDQTIESESGHAILARGPIAKMERLALPTDEHGGERIALSVETDVDGHRVVACSIHLSHLRSDDLRRREQLETILAQRWWRQPAALRVLGGDCNATLDSAALDWLSSHRDPTVSSVWSNGNAPHTHPLPPRETRRGRAIDHLFVVTPPDETRPSLIRAHVALAETIDGVYPSDHAAVVAELLPA